MEDWVYPAWPERAGKVRGFPTGKKVPKHGTGHDLDHHEKMYKTRATTEVHHIFFRRFLILGS